LVIDFFIYLFDGGDIMIFDEITKFVKGEMYTKVLTASNSALTTEWTIIKKFTVPYKEGYVGVIHSINADESVDAELDILVEESTIGEKYGSPFRTKALVDPVYLNVVVEKGDVEFRARMRSGTGTLGYFVATVILVKKEAIK